MERTTEATESDWIATATHHNDVQVVRVAENCTELRDYFHSCTTSRNLRDVIPLQRVCGVCTSGRVSGSKH